MRIDWRWFGFYMLLALGTDVLFGLSFRDAVSWLPMDLGFAVAVSLKFE